MTTIFKKVEEIISDNDCPLPISVIPNQMGINLNSVEGISWQKQDDGQLTQLTIHFIPSAGDYEVEIEGEKYQVKEEVWKLIHSISKERDRLRNGSN